MKKSDKKKDSRVKKRYFEVEEKLEDALPKPVDESEQKKKKKDLGDIIKLKPKKLHKEKKKIVSALKNLHEILGNNKEADEEEQELEKIVFGGNFFDDINEEQDVPIIKDSEEHEITKKPAWDDKDDQNILIKEKAKFLKNCHRSVTVRGEEKYAEFVQEKFKKIVGEPEWADLERKPVDFDADSDDELLQQTGNFIKKSESLPKGQIGIRKCGSLTHENLKGAIVKSVEFHPTSRVALVTGTNGIANLFQVDGKQNSKIQSIYLESFPIHTAHFTIDGNEIIAGSNVYGFYYSYDMLNGKVVKIPWQKGMEQRNIRRFQMSPDGKYIAIHGRYGNIHLVTMRTKEWIGSLKMNGEVIAVAFNNDGTKLYSHGEFGEVYVWDMNSRRCIYKFVDEGCITGTAIATSLNDQFVATGSDSGIVNIYNSTTLNTTSPIPVKVLKNLTTEITALKFNCTTELLAVGSSHKIGAAKLVHVPSLSVFPNFPTKDDFNSMKNLNSVDISPNSAYLLLGSNRGTALLYRLKHYKNY